jgi:hypothetical protein
MLFVVTYIMNIINTGNLVTMHYMRSDTGCGAGRYENDDLLRILSPVSLELNTIPSGIFVIEFDVPDFKAHMLRYEHAGH